MQYAYSGVAGQPETDLRCTEIERDLGAEHSLRLKIMTEGDLSPLQMDALEKAVRLIHLSLDCILIRQNDRDTLGSEFARLSDREWQVCTALEKPVGEKQIADTLSCSRHTVHSYVKSLYRKLRVQSRLQVLDQLKAAREELRRRTLEDFGTAKVPASSRRERQTQSV
jgi:ATP/maltotriose-dependent transcriptional regulator MalT